MGFWGIEVKPGKPHPYHSDNVQGSLYVTQATLGLGSATERSILQCAAGHKDPVFLCSLLPGQSECCSLNLEFKDELVAFSVVGPRSIHLSGYFVSDEGDNLRDEYEYDSEEGIADTESDYESSDYDEDYSDESMEYANDDDAEMFPPAHKSGVVIEEIVDEDMTKDTNDLSKRKKRKKSENIKKDAVDNSSLREDAIEQASLDEGKSTSADQKKKNKKKKKTEQKEEGKNENPAKKEEGKAFMLSEEKQSTANPSQIRTFPNGLVIEELEIGVPDGKRASDGSKVGVHYTGRLKKNGKIFDSKVSGKPFEFRLGVGEVIKGWDVGVKGMRVGDKRRLTIPPSMGYGAKATGPIPPNAWLEFDVELLNVR